MNPRPLRVLLVVGSLSQVSATKSLLLVAAEKLRNAGCVVDLLDLGQEPLVLFNPDSSRSGPEYAALQSRVERADVLVLGTPDYHGSISSALKNFLDHLWHEFAGKLFATLVVSSEKGLTVTDQLRTVARQCYAWTLPYGLAVADTIEFKDGDIVSHSLAQRLEMWLRDLRVYGQLLAQQREADLAAREPGFMARYRKP